MTCAPPLSQNAHFIHVPSPNRISITSLAHTATRRLVPDHFVLGRVGVAIEAVSAVHRGVAPARARLLVEQLCESSQPSRSDSDFDLRSFPTIRLQIGACQTRK